MRKRSSQHLSPTVLKPRQTAARLRNSPVCSWYLVLRGDGVSQVQEKQREPEKKREIPMFPEPEERGSSLRERGNLGRVTPRAAQQPWGHTRVVGTSVGVMSSAHGPSLPSEKSSRPLSPAASSQTLGMALLSTALVSWISEGIQCTSSQKNKQK